MTKVFIGGSRHVSRLSREFRERLDRIMENGFPIVIGDANGADRAVQQYLHENDYENVEVFFSGGVCRNNVGDWPTHDIVATTRHRTAEFYSAKDRVMAREASVGLMLWDGKSVGTLLNVYRLLSLQKEAVIYVVPEKRFLEFRSGAEWERFLASREVGLRRKVEERTRREIALQNEPFQLSFLGERAGAG